MNIAAVVLLFIGLFLAIVSFVVLGLPSLVTGDHIYAMYRNGFSDIFGGLKTNFLNMFNFPLMFEASSAKNELVFFLILVGVLGVGAIMLIVHFVMLCVHRKGRAIGPGLLWIALTGLTYVLVAIFLVPVPMGRTFLLADGVTVSTEWVDATHQGDFMSIIAAVKAENNGWASAANSRVQLILLLPFYFACGAYGFGLLGFILSLIDVSKKKKKVAATLGADGQPLPGGSPIQVVVQNVPGKDRVIVIPAQGTTPPQKNGPQMVQYINSYAEEGQKNQFATENDVRQAIRQELNGETPDPTPNEGVGQGQVPPASQYMTEEEARQSIRDAIAQKNNR